MSETPTRPLDRRTVDRYIKRGDITDKDVEKHIKALPDLADEAVVIDSKLDMRSETAAN